MTRFWITLDQGVQSCSMPEPDVGRRDFRPEDPSMRRVDPPVQSARLQDHVVGSRPGEKLHERWCRGTTHFDVRARDYFAIVPPSRGPDGYVERTAAPWRHGFGSSDTNDRWLTVPELLALSVREDHRQCLSSLWTAHTLRPSLLPYGRQLVDDGDIDAVVQVLRRTV